MNFDNVALILGEARQAAFASAAWPDNSPVDPDVRIRESIAALAPVAPSVGTAAALLTVAGVHPVALDRESLRPTSTPMTTLSQVEDHWLRSHQDGVGVRAGVQPDGSSLFAVRGAVAHLRAWLAAAGSIDGHYLPVSRYVQVLWTPPPAPAARSLTSFGAAIDQLRALPGDRDQQVQALVADGWLVWTAAVAWAVPGERGDRLEVASRKLRGGVEVIGEGDVVPWHLRDPRGWTLSGSNVPLADDGEPFSPWLVDAVHGSWKPVSA